jgi:hypothetical protein
MGFEKASLSLETGTTRRLTAIMTKM